MAHAPLPLAPRRFGETMRTDAWWIQPIVVFVILSGFIVYSTWAAFQGKNYWFHANGADYLSPFYSPEIFGDSPHAWFGPKPGWWPGFAPFSPALLILWAPGGFRFTCYYYRGAYYKAFWQDPTSCAVGEPRKSYLGEKFFPLIFQNIHRYFLYLAVAFLFLLAHDLWQALWFVDASGVTHFGVGLGHDHPRGQSHPAQWIHTRLPLHAPSGWRGARSYVGAPGAEGGVRLLQPVSTAVICDGPGAACSWWPFPTSTFASARWASGMTGGCSNGRVRDARA